MNTFQEVIAADTALMNVVSLSELYADQMLSNAEDISLALSPTGLGKKPTKEGQEAWNTAKALYAFGGVEKADAQRKAVQRLSQVAYLVAHVGEEVRDGAWVMAARSLVNGGVSAAEILAALDSKTQKDPLKFIASARKAAEGPQEVKAKRGAAKETADEKKVEKAAKPTAEKVDVADLAGLTDNGLLTLLERVAAEITRRKFAGQDAEERIIAASDSIVDYAISLSA